MGRFFLPFVLLSIAIAAAAGPALRRNAVERHGQEAWIRQDWQSVFDACMRDRKFFSTLERRAATQGYCADRADQEVRAKGHEPPPHN